MPEAEIGDSTIRHAFEKAVGIQREPQVLQNPNLQPEQPFSTELPVFHQLLTELRDSGVPATTSEFLDLQKVLEAGKIHNLDELYPIARAVMVKDVTFYDRYDEVFARLFGSYITEVIEEPETEIEAEKTDEKMVPKEENKSQNVVEEPGLTEENHGGDDAHKAIKDSPASAKDGEGKSEQKREENIGKGQQNEGNAGGSQNEKGKDGGGLKAEGEGGGEKKQEGVGGGEKNAENVNTGGQGVEDETKEIDSKGGKGKEKKKKKKNKKRGGKGGYAVSEKLEKRLARREFKPFDKDEIINTSQFERVLARLTTIIKKATDEPTQHLDIRATVERVAQNGGLPELVYAEEEETKPAMILMFDVGGSTDDFRPIVEQLFKAATETLRELEIYYFHNAIYGEVWPAKDGNYGKNFVPLEAILRKEPDAKVVIVGDAWMADSDSMNGGLHDSADDLNRTNNGGFYSRTGYDNFRAIVDRFPSTVWINPILERQRADMDNSGTIDDLERLFPTYELTLNGLEQAVQKLMSE